MTSNINTNIASLNAQRNLNVSQGSLSTTLQRLSSGLRISSAKDDAEGLAISERFTSQVKGLDLSARIANDGISLLQTAEGGLSNVGDLLQRLRELAVESANISNSTPDRIALQNEALQLTQELNRIADTTQFNGQNVLDGTLTSSQFQVGANASQTISVGIASAKASDIGNHLFESRMSSAISGAAVDTFAGNGFAAQKLTIAGNGNSSAFDLNAGANAKLIAAAVNGVTSSTGVAATASTTATISGVLHSGAISFELFGANTESVTISATISDPSDLAAVAQAANARSGVTNITAVADKSGKLVLSENAGNDIGIKNQGLAGQGLDGARFAGGGTAAADGAVTLGAGGSNSAQVGGQVVFSAASGFAVGTDKVGTLVTAESNASTLHPVSAIDVSTTAGATDAISTIDAALNSITNNRASLGALQNRFAANIGNLQSTSENLSAVRSRITDADFAMETTNLTRGQILQQAGTALLAQANALPNGVLALLRE